MFVSLVLLLKSSLVDQLRIFNHLLNLSSHFLILHVDDGQLLLVVNHFSLLLLNSQNGIFLLILEPVYFVSQLVHSQLVFAGQKSAKYRLLFLWAQRLLFHLTFQIVIHEPALLIEIDYRFILFKDPALLVKEPRGYLRFIERHVFRFTVQFVHSRRLQVVLKVGCRRVHVNRDHCLWFRSKIFKFFRINFGWILIGTKFFRTLQKKTWPLSYWQEALWSFWFRSWVLGSSSIPENGLLSSFLLLSLELLLVYPSQIQLQLLKFFLVIKRWLFVRILAWVQRKLFLHLGLMDTRYLSAHLANSEGSTIER